MSKLGKMRRSQVISTYGPGAIIDFRAGGKGGAAISVVAGGLDAWDDESLAGGLRNDQCIYEPRLQKKLGVKGFRLPPVGFENHGAGGKTDRYPRKLAAVRFPQWLQCPACNDLKPAIAWTEDPGDPALYCGSCSRQSDSGKRVHVVPVRFVVACEAGHLDEFPWHRWVGHSAGCDRKKPLQFLTRGAGLKGLFVRCRGCNSECSMDGAFSGARMKKLGLKCNGRRPWLPGQDEACTITGPPKVLQRGASNLYFPAIDSAIDIPPWTDEFQAALGHSWSAIETCDTDDDVRTLVRIMIHPMWDDKSISLEALQDKILQRRALANSPERADIRGEEYQQLTLAEATRQEKSEFSIRPEPVPELLKNFIGVLTRIERLREVRAIYGFTRVYPPSGEFGAGHCSPLSASPKDWLPATEVRGEGIFLALSEDALEKWENGTEVMARAADVNNSWEKTWIERQGDDAEPPLRITPRLLLVHTLSHILMRQLSLQCGYSTSALRERLYVEEGEPGMCGLLIYTSAADSDGTLGGLVRQGTGKRIEQLLTDAVRASEWCSSDPLCMNGLSSLSEASNMAACHSCVLAPETACEHFNRFLDRATIVGTPEHPEVGFFAPLLKRDGC